MSDLAILKIKELTLCGNCKRTFNNSNLQPKLLTCRHHFCLECIQSGFSKTHGSQSKPHEIYCSNCWKLTDLSEGGAESLETYEAPLELANSFYKLTLESTVTTKNGVNGTDINHLDSENSLAHTEICHVHSKPLKLWCLNCGVPLCNDCANQEHSDVTVHTLWTEEAAKDQMIKQANGLLVEMAKLDEHIQQLSLKQRQFLILVRNALGALKQDAQANLDNLEIQWSMDSRAAEIRKSITQTEVLLKDTKTPRQIHDLMKQLFGKHKILQDKCQQMIILCQLNDLVGNSTHVFNFDTLQIAVNSIIEGKRNATSVMQPNGPDPILFLANYCMSQLYSRQANGIDTDRPQEDISAQRQFIEGRPDIPYNGELLGGIPDIPFNAVTPQFNDPIPYPQNNIDVDVPHQEPILHPQLSPSPTPPDVPDHVSVASSSATPQRVDSPSIIPQSEEPRASPIPRTSAAQMYPIESTDTIDPQVHSVKLKPLPNVYPRYYFNIEINGIARGRFVIETCPDVAPKMCRNFDRLCTQDGKPSKMSYKGCCFFQCWKGESVITGDFEYNTGRGGKSIYEDNYFMPDDTRFPAVRGAVGMRRQQKGHENFGLVGSQFRVLLQEMTGFTGIFGHVIEGLELIDKIAAFGDHTGKPAKPIIITRCGKL